MKFGLCTGIDRATLLADTGFDFIELSAAGDLMPDMPESEWATKRDAILAMPLPPLAFNGFVRSLKITGPNVDQEALRKYVEVALSRAKLVGGEVIVFGSGGARNVPDGFDRTTAEKQIRDFLLFCADAHDKTGVVVVIEPLNLKESNILTTVAEAAAFAAPIARPGVRILADTYHMEQDAEPVSHIGEFGELLSHVHTADTLRVAPGFGQYDHVEMFRQMKRAHYDSRISIECKWDDLMVQAPQSLAHLKEAYKTANA